MAAPRSPFYDEADLDSRDDTALVGRMHAIQGELPAYGYRRTTAQLERLRFAVSLPRGSLQRARKTIASAQRAAADVFGTLDAIVTPGAPGETLEGSTLRGPRAAWQLTRADWM